MDVSEIVGGYTDNHTDFIDFVKAQLRTPFTSPKDIEAQQELYDWIQDGQHPHWQLFKKEIGELTGRTNVEVNGLRWYLTAALRVAVSVALYPEIPEFPPVHIHTIHTVARIQIKDLNRLIGKTLGMRVTRIMGGEIIPLVGKDCLPLF